MLNQQLALGGWNLLMEALQVLVYSIRKEHCCTGPTIQQVVLRVVLDQA